MLFTEKRKEVEEPGGEGRLFRWNRTRPKVYPTDTAPAHDQLCGQDCSLQHYTLEQRTGTRQKSIHRTLSKHILVYSYIEILFLHSL